MDYQYPQEDKGAILDRWAMLIFKEQMRKGESTIIAVMSCYSFARDALKTRSPNANNK